MFSPPYSQQTVCSPPALTLIQRRDAVARILEAVVAPLGSVPVDAFLGVIRAADELPSWRAARQSAQRPVHKEDGWHVGESCALIPAPGKDYRTAAMTARPWRHVVGGDAAFKANWPSFLYTFHNTAVAANTSTVTFLKFSYIYWKFSSR